MAVSASFLEFLLEQLHTLRHVTSRRMFGGVGLYSDGVFFSVIDNDTVFFKVNDDTRSRYESAGMPPFAPIPDKPPMRGYYQVPVSVLEDADRLTSWAQEAVAVGEAASAGKSKTPAVRRRKRAPTKKSSKRR